MRRRLLTGLWAVVPVCAGILVTFAPVSAGGFWLTALWVTWGAAVVWTLTRPSFSLLFAAIEAAMLLFVVLPGTEAQLFGHTTLAGNYYQAGVAQALEISALAQVGMLAGAIAARTLWPVQGFRRVRLRLSPAGLDRAAGLSLSTGVLGVLALSLLGGASLSNFFVYTSAGGYGSFGLGVTGNYGYLVAAQCAAGLAVVLLPLRLGAAGRARRVAPLCCAGLATVVLLGDGQRARFFVPVFAAGLIWLKTSRRDLPLRRVAIAGACVLVLLGGLIGVARAAAGDRNVTVGTVLAQPFGSGNNLFLPLSGAAATVPGEFPYLHGSSYLQAVIYPIPRALWHGKPQSAIQTLTGVIDPSNSGVAFPEFGEMYLNFGLAGVVAGSVLLGALIEVLWRRFAQSAGVREPLLIAVVGAVILEIFTRGALAPMLTTFDGLLLLTWLVCRPRSRVLAETAAPAAPGPAASPSPRQAVTT